MSTVEEEEEEEDEEEERCVLDPISTQTPPRYLLSFHSFAFWNHQLCALLLSFCLAPFLAYTRSKQATRRKTHATHDPVSFVHTCVPDLLSLSVSLTHTLSLFPSLSLHLHLSE